jgi:hypothetical protein
MADTTLDEIGVVQVYDCYTFTALLTLEDYGFIPKMLFLIALVIALVNQQVMRRLR